MSEAVDQLDDGNVFGSLKLESQSESESSSARPVVKLTSPAEEDFIPNLAIPEPVFYPSAVPPFCHRCKKYDHEEYFSRQCPFCEQNVETASVPEIFAILRQWDSDTQKDCQYYLSKV